MCITVHYTSHLSNLANEFQACGCILEVGDTYVLLGLANNSVQSAPEFIMIKA